MVANPFAQTNNEFMDTFNPSLTRSVIKFYDSNDKQAMADQGST